ncbi:MAG: phosphatase PAP2 family protein [Rikenellaceae bacterium]
MKYWLVQLLVFLTLVASAQESNPESKSHKKFLESNSFEVLHVGLPLVATGLAFTPSTGEFKSLRDSYCLNAHTSVDDYLQYSPAALMIGLKSAGVESRSSWGRMLTSDALSVVIVTLATNGLKSSIDVGRPDTGAKNSFPSGHTATAFMTATMLHKEYGAVSKWYSIGGYTAATATGLMRVVNNRHWIRDVVVGAGLGILATEAGYLLADMIFKERGINRDLDRFDTPSWYDIEKPSTIGLYLGSVMPTGKISDTTELEMGSVVGLEGAYFFGKHIGVGGRLALANAALTESGVTLEDEVDIISGDVGCYFAFPFTPRLRFGTKALAGIKYYKEYLTISKGARAALGTGLSLEYLANRHFSMKAFCDYDAAYVTSLPKSNIYQTVTLGFVGSIIF